MNYYNEYDPKIAAWLRGLISAGLIPAGHVDTRSIVDVMPGDLAGFTQCHFFAGISGWSLALRLAGWPADRPVWTGSCPCQPYSVAGKGKGDADERNLWPEFFRLIRECRPECVFGEQVESAIGHGWLDGVSRDLEGEGYAVAAAVLGAHSVSAPHIRQRLYWVADSAMHAGPEYEHEPRSGSRRPAGPCDSAECRGDHGGLADSANVGLPGSAGSREPRGVASAAHGGGLGDASCAGSQGRRLSGPGEGATVGRAGAWSDFRIIQCRDDKFRRIPVERAFFPLAPGISSKRMGEVRTRLAGMGLTPTEIKRALRRPGSILAMASKHRAGVLHGAGNAIVPQTAATFITAFLSI